MCDFTCSGAKTPINRIESSRKEPYEALSDEALLASLADGDSAAQDALIRRYTRLIRACARPYFLNGGDSEDLLQEGLLGLLSAIRSYDPAKSSFRTFAVLCIRRSIISAVRAAQNHNNAILNDSLSIDQVLSEDGTSLPLTAQDPEALIIHRDERRRLERELSRSLSDFEQHVLTLYLKGLSYREMASALGRPPKSIDNAVQRIRRKYEAVCQEE
ncbi:MAG: sigma-70 family RNA polymerase sigma factor [Ruminococcaceae bacterium]|nr:sigma-70 family RNA polymerase sigma factor [Oscillospiraceae bacterium]